MNRLWKFAVAGSAAMTLAACAGLQLQHAKKVTPQGSEFDNALAKNYLAASQTEYDWGDYWDSDVFAVSSMTAAQGSAVLPAEIGSRMLPEGKVGELSSARASLVAALDGNARSRNPEQAARAQVCFDHWMEEQEENFQAKEIAKYRDCFNDAMAKLGSRGTTAVMPGGFLVFFDWNKSNLTPEAFEIVQTIAVAAKGVPSAPVDVVGHTDTSGSAVYNQGLSERRATTVRRALVDMSVTNPISTMGKGETQPLVPTGDGVREPQNRRVEVNVSK